MKKLLLILSIIPSLIFCQPHDELPTFAKKLPFESQIISLPAGQDSFLVYFTYYVPYRLLVFERNEQSFTAGFRVIIEIFNDDNSLVARDIKDNKITVNSFDETNDLHRYMEDYLKFNVKSGIYIVKSFISDKNAAGELPLEPVKFNLENDKTVLHPIVIGAEKIFCNGDSLFSLTNSGAKIPFRSSSSHLILPVTDTSISFLEISIENNNEVILSRTITESYILNAGISKCDNHLVVIGERQSEKIKYFVLRNVSDRLNEGKIEIDLKNEEKSINEKFHLNVAWLDKPFSLMDPERAIEFLDYIESDSVVYPMLKQRSSDYQEILVNYWKKYDPTPSTTFNEIMSEYYARVDYSIKEFRGIGKENGAKTDRGIIYIRFGQPDKIERTSNPQGQVVEIWTYLKADKKFSFIDENGTGNFSLTKN